MLGEFPGFCNVDVDLASNLDLSKVASYLRSKDISIHCAERITAPGHKFHKKFLITLEDEPGGHSKTREPVSYLQNMVNILGELRETFPHEYSSLEFIDFDIGFEETDTIPNTRFTIPNNTLQSIAELGGTITWTLYAASRGQATE